MFDFIVIHLLLNKLQRMESECERMITLINDDCISSIPPSILPNTDYDDVSMSDDDDYNDITLQATSSSQSDYSEYHNYYTNRMQIFAKRMQQHNTAKPTILDGLRAEIVCFEL